MTDVDVREQDRLNNRDRENASNRGTDAASFLSAKQGAALLGVKPATFYTYVSRGWIRRLTSSGTTASVRKLYLRGDIDRLKARADARSGHRAVAENALRWGQPVLDTELTLIAGGRLYYRGHDVRGLIGGGLEETARLLWNGDFPPFLSLVDGAIRRSVEQSRLRAQGARLPLLRMQKLVLTLAETEPTMANGQGVDDRQRAARLVVGLANTFSDQPWDTGAGSLEAALAKACSLPPAAVAGLRTALVGCADHGLNASTLACRVAASTGANLYACTMAGLAALSGPKHGGACDRVDALLIQARRRQNPQALLAERAARGEDLPGFGHPLYPEGDPRAKALLAATNAFPARAQGRQIRCAAEGLLQAAAEQGFPPPTLDFGLSVLSGTLGLPVGTAAALFALGRSVGWVAHVFEQQAAGHLIRPRARYVGPPPS